MANKFTVTQLSRDLDTLGSKIEAVDMEKVERRSLKRAAEVMSEMVRQAVSAEDDIQFGLNSIYDQGPGPSMHHRNAWLVEQVGDSYRVRPHPQVEQRAVVLNYGYPGRIYPDGDGPLRFYVEGVPVFAESVKGPEYTGYWQAAMRRFRASGRLGEISADELQKEFNEKF